MEENHDRRHLPRMGKCAHRDIPSFQMKNSLHHIADHAFDVGTGCFLKLPCLFVVVFQIDILFG